MWLRDNCPCPDCRDPQNGQKLFQVTDLPEDLEVDSIEETGDCLRITFAPDGHRSIFKRAWLSDQCGAAPGDGRTEQDKLLWRAEDLADKLPVTSWSLYRNDDAERLRALRDVARLGFAIVREPRCWRAPSSRWSRPSATSGRRITAICSTCGSSSLRPTWLSPGSPSPLTQTTRIETRFRRSSFCIASPTRWRVVNRAWSTASRLLRRYGGRIAPHSRCSRARPSRSLGRMRSARLRAVRPLIETDTSGRIRGVRFNNRSMQALRLQPAALAEFYRAYRSFAAIIARPELQLEFRLEVGDCLIFDNTRLLHARSAFSDTGGGARHLQGCYADIDGLLSTIAVLEGALGEQVPEGVWS